jgi:integrase
MLKNNVNIKVFQKRAGHSNIQTTLGTYAHVLDDMEQAAVNNIIY